MFNHKVSPGLVGALVILFCVTLEEVWFALFGQDVFDRFIDR